MDCLSWFYVSHVELPFDSSQHRTQGFPGGTSGKEPTCQCGRCKRCGSSVPGSGRSPREGYGNPLQYSCWRIPWTEEPGRLQSIGSESDITEASKHACTHTAQTSECILHSSPSKSGKHQNSGHSCPCIWVLSLTLLNKVSVISPCSSHHLLNSVQVPCNCLTLNSPLIPGTWNTPSPSCSMARAA